MKPTIGYAQPKRLARPKKSTKLELRRRGAKPEPSGEIEIEQQNSFWKWVGIVALLHVVAITIVGLYYASSPPPPPPPEQMISLLPPGDVVKGTPEPVAAPKLGPTTPAPSVAHHHAAPPPPTPTPVVAKPVPAPTPKPTPLVKSDAPALVPDKPTPPAPPKPKVKVDLTLADGPTPAPAPKHPVKPKVKKVAPPAVTDDSNAPDRDAPDNPDSDGLSKEQIAQQLGAKLKAAGAETALNHGTDGSNHSQANKFQDFYRMVHDQVMDRWTSPNLVDESAASPRVTFQVTEDGHVLPDTITLTRTSGNGAYDQSALAAVRSLGQLREPLPQGCDPVIYIDFKLTR